MDDTIGRCLVILACMTGLLGACNDSELADCETSECEPGGTYDEVFDVTGQEDGEATDNLAAPGSTRSVSSITAYDVAACPGRRGTLALRYDYDNPPFLAGGTLEVQGSQPWSLTTTTTGPRFGRKSGRSELRYGDPEAYGGPRAELAVVGKDAASRFKAGKTAYYGVSILIPAGWVNDGGVEDILFQWKGPKDAALGEADHSPNVYLGIKRNEWVLRITSDANPVTTATSALKEQAVLVTGLNTSVDTWHDFVFRITWAYQGTAGKIEAWHKLAGAPGYNKVLTKTGPNMHNDAAAGYLKWGIYKPSWRLGPSAPTVRIVRHDEVRAGDTFAIVEPGCSR